MKIKAKINDWCSKPTVILIITIIFSLIGGALGVFAYYEHWLG